MGRGIWDENCHMELVIGHANPRLTLVTLAVLEQMINRWAAFSKKYISIFLLQ